MVDDDEVSRRNSFNRIGLEITQRGVDFSAEREKERKKKTG